MSRWGKHWQGPSWNLAAWTSNSWVRNAHVARVYAKGPLREAPAAHVDLRVYTRACICACFPTGSLWCLGWPLNR